MNARTRRLTTFTMPLVLTAVAACTPRAVGAGSACQLSVMSGSSIERDVLSSAAALGQEVISVGTRFNGTFWLPLASFSSDGRWAPEVIPAFSDTVIELDDVSTVGTQAWAVGSFAGKVPVAARWDGAQWIQTPMDDPGPGEDGLAGVKALAPDLVWAVGRHQVGAGYQTLTERWDGTSWTALPSPNVGSTSNSLKEVDSTGANDVWSVGWYVHDQHYRPLIEHWDGKTWTIVPTQDVGPGDGFLSGVVAVATNDAWAVGWTSQHGSRRPLIERWDGHSWSLVEPPPEATNASLTAAAAIPDGLLTVGRLVTGTQTRPLALLRNGDTWSMVPTPMDETASFTGVTVDASDTIWAVGTAFPDNNVAESLVMTGCPAS